MEEASLVPLQKHSSEEKGYGDQSRCCGTCRVVPRTPSCCSGPLLFFWSGDIRVAERRNRRAAADPILVRAVPTANGAVALLIRGLQVGRAAVHSVPEVFLNVAGDFRVEEELDDFHRAGATDAEDAGSRTSIDFRAPADGYGILGGRAGSVS